MARFSDDIDPANLIAFAEAWSKLGNAVSDQARAVLEDPASVFDQNPNALRLAARELRGFSASIDAALDEALEDYAAEELDCTTETTA